MKHCNNVLALFLCLLLGTELSAQDKSATAEMLWFAMQPQDSLCLKDSCIQVDYDFYADNDKKLAKEFATSPMLRIHVTNLTDSLLYVDLAASYIVRGTSAQVLYVPSTTTTVTQGGNNTTTAKVVGTVATMVGGGLLGTVATAAVGGKSSETTTTVTEAQRFAVIPAHTTLTVVKDVNVFNEDMIAFPPFNQWIRMVGSGNILKKETQTICAIPQGILAGEIREYDINKAPFSLGGIIAYSQNGDLESLETLRTNYAVTRVIGTAKPATWKLKSNKWSDEELITSVFPQWRTYKVVRLIAK